MGINTPLPQPLPKECAKAAKIFRSFVDSSNNGLDGIIPRSVLENAKGFAIFTVVKAGFVFSARAGSGVVIARLPDGTWSAPSAIGSAGIGFGSQIGAEVTDFLVVLNSRSAVKSFMSAGSVTLGTNMSIAVGPLGRNGEASGSVSTGGKIAAMYSYSKTRGLFGGVSLEGSVIVERQDANALAYQSDVSAKALLSGNVSPQPWAETLITTLQSCTGLPGGRTWIDDSDSARSLGMGPSGDSQYAFGTAGSLESPRHEQASGSLGHKPKKSITSGFPPVSWGRQKNNGSYFVDVDDQNVHPSHYAPPSDPPPDYFPAKFESHEQPLNNFHADLKRDLPPSPTKPYAPPPGPPPFHAAFSFESSPQFPHEQSADQHSIVSHEEDPFASIAPQPTSNKPERHISPKPGLAGPLTEGVGRALALFKFDAVESDDISFQKGDVIIILEKTEDTDDWWRGKVAGSNLQGSFPANYVELV